MRSAAGSTGNRPPVAPRCLVVDSQVLGWIVRIEVFILRWWQLPRAPINSTLWAGTVRRELTREECDEPVSR